MNRSTELSVVIVSYGVRQYLLPCIGSVIAACRGIEHEIIVVDNASADGSAEAVKEQFPGVSLIANQTNAGFAGANNQGYGISRGEYVLLLNPDTLTGHGAIKTVLDFMKVTPDAGLAGCRMVDENGEMQKTIRRMPSVAGNIMQALFLDWLVYSEHKKATYYRERPFKIGYPNGAFMMVRRSALKDTPLLNEDYFMYAEEKDLAFRLNRNGYACYFVPGAQIVHYGGKSTGQTALPMFLELQKSQIKYYRMHYDLPRARMLIASWWLVLLSNYITSIPFMFTNKNNSKYLLFKAALLKYFQYMREI